MSVRARATRWIYEFIPGTSRFRRMYPLSCSIKLSACSRFPAKIAGRAPIILTSWGGCAGCWGALAGGAGAPPPGGPDPPPPPPPPGGPPGTVLLSALCKLCNTSAEVAPVGADCVVVPDVVAAVVWVVVAVAVVV